VLRFGFEKVPLKVWKFVSADHADINRMRKNVRRMSQCIPLSNLERGTGGEVLESSPI
jgi:hypothetical protein